MGLSTNQASLLMLTSSINDARYRMTVMNDRKSDLARESAQEAKDYNAAMTNQKWVMKVNDSKSDLGYRKADLSYSDLTSMGYILTDSSNKIYLTKENGKWVVPTANNLSETKIFDSDVEVDETDGKEKISIKGKKYEVIDGTELVSNNTKLQNNIVNGILFIWNTTGNDTFGSPINDLAANSSFELVYDTSDDAAAQSKHDYNQKIIAQEDARLDSEIKTLEVDITADMKEKESIEEAQKKVIETTFKLDTKG